MKILAFITWILIISAWFYIDAHRNNKSKKKLLGQGLGNDIASWFIKFGIAFMIILGIAYQFNTRYVADNEAWGLLILFSAIAWILEVVYNLKRKGVKWNHIGTTAITDRIFRGSFLVQSLVKLTLLISGICVYYLI